MPHEDESAEIRALIDLATSEPHNRVEHLTAAVALGSIRAMCLLGDDAKSEATSAYWYRQALTLNGESRDGLVYGSHLGLTPFGDNSHLAAMKMADLLTTKKITAESFESPEFYLEIAARKGNAEGALSLSRRLVMTHDLENLLKAEEWLIKIADMGRREDDDVLPIVGEGALQLAILYMNELEDPAHGPESVFDLVLLARQHGNLHAAEMAGKMSMQGYGSAADPKRGVELIAEAAAGTRFTPGLTSAKLGLVGIYLQGFGAEPNPELAATLLVQLAHLASSETAEAPQITMYVEMLDEVARRNPDLDLKWHRRMMQNSQDVLSVLNVFIEATEAGTDVLDPAKLIRLMRGMPEANIYAQWQLAKALGATGSDDARACLKRAAKAGLPEACTLLANWYRYGLHGPEHQPDAGYYAEVSVSNLTRMGLVGHAAAEFRLVGEIQGDEIKQEHVAKYELAKTSGIAHLCIY